EWARNLAVTAEDAPRHVDLVDLGVPFAGRDTVLRRVLGGDDADAVRGARGSAQRAAHALLEPGVLKAMQLVAAAKARIHRCLLLGVLDRDGTLDELAEGRREPAQRRAESPRKAAQPAGLGPAL